VTPDWSHPRDALHREIAKLRQQVADRDDQIAYLNSILMDTETDFSVRWHLTPLEKSILSLLMSGRVMSREKLTEFSEPSVAQCKNNIAVMITRLRRKLSGDGIEIETVWGSGYILRKPTIALIKQLCSASAVAA
jgi:DNA-binding response OmpR family regulator